jgi:MORN repeat
MFKRHSWYFCYTLRGVAKCSVCILGEVALSCSPFILEFICRTYIANIRHDWSHWAIVVRIGFYVVWWRCRWSHWSIWWDRLLQRNYFTFFLLLELTSEYWCFFDVATTAANFSSAMYVCLSIDIINRCHINPGCAHSDNGCKYDGVFINGMMHGVGKFLWSDGVEYEGDFVNGEVLKCEEKSNCLLFIFKI